MQSNFLFSQIFTVNFENKTISFSQFITKIHYYNINIILFFFNVFVCVWSQTSRAAVNVYLLTSLITQGEIKVTLWCFFVDALLFLPSYLFLHVCTEDAGLFHLSPPSPILYALLHCWHSRQPNTKSHKEKPWLLVAEVISYIKGIKGP